VTTVKEVHRRIQGLLLIEMEIEGMEVEVAATTLFLKLVKVEWNFENLHLVEELQPKVGAREGAGGTQLGAITHEGVTEFMGVRLPCYVADISKSVIGLGLLTSEYGFEVLFKGENMYIFASRSGESVTVQVSNNKSFLLPETLFRQPVVSIMRACLATGTLVSLFLSWRQEACFYGTAGGV
jgi:hypothetical protein